MIVQTLDRYIEIIPAIMGGKPHIAGHRITIQNIVIWHEWMGHGADQIATEYNLTLAQVYAALAYYYDNRLEIEKSIQESKAFVEELRKQIPSKLNPNDMKNHIEFL